MNVYRVGDDGERHLVGRADVSADALPIHREPLAGRAPAVEDFIVGNITRFVAGEVVVERAVLLAASQSASQPPELLPVWTPCKRDTFWCLRVRAVLSAALIAMPAAAQQRAIVIDGDTFPVCGERVRLICLDAPEMHGRCLREVQPGHSVAGRLEQLLAAGIIFERHGAQRYKSKMSRADLEEAAVARAVSRGRES